MKLLLVGLNYAPEPVGIGPYTTGMAEALVQRGHAVRVIAGKPYYPQWRSYGGYRGLWHRSRESGVEIIRCAHFVPGQPRGMARIVHLASFAASALIPAMRQVGWRPDVVLCVAPALLSVPTAWLAARASGARLWVHVQDFEVEAAFATGLVQSRGVVARVALATERALLRLADRVSTISPQMAARAVAKGMPPDRVLEIRNWADDRFAPSVAGAERLRAQWQLGARQVALYSGNIAQKQGIEIIVGAARALAQRDDIAFVICGEGPNRKRLESMIEGLPNVLLKPLQPAEEMGALLALADVHLLPQIPGAADLVLPSKLTNMLASNRPVVVTALPGTGLYAEVQGCGVLTAPGDAKQMAEAVARLIDDPGLRLALGNAAGQRARDRWSKAAAIDTLEREMNRLMGA